VNWRDNPWFNKELESERVLDKEQFPDSYAHVWEGISNRRHRELLRLPSEKGPRGWQVNETRD